MEAYLKDHSDGSVTVEWQSGGQAVMEATFVHGSPYVYVKAYQGELVIRTLRVDGGFVDLVPCDRASCCCDGPGSR